MFGPLTQSQILLLAGPAVLVMLISIATRVIARVVLGKDWAVARVKIPWRFSLLAIAVLTVIVACVFGLLRDDPPLAILAAGITLLLWFPIARFQEFQQVLAQRRRRALADSLDAHRSSKGNAE